MTHALHDDLGSRGCSTMDGNLARKGGIIPSKACLAHTTAIVNDEHRNLLSQCDGEVATVGMKNEWQEDTKHVPTAVSETPDFF